MLPMMRHLLLWRHNYEHQNTIEELLSHSQHVILSGWSHNRLLVRHVRWTLTAGWARDSSALSCWLWGRINGGWPVRWPFVSSNQQTASSSAVVLNGLVSWFGGRLALTVCNRWWSKCVIGGDRSSSDSVRIPRKTWSRVTGWASLWRPSSYSSCCLSEVLMRKLENPISSWW